MRLQSILHRYALLLLLLCAFWVRVADLSNAPPGLYYDEAAHGLDALRVWQGELYIFFPTANGHEPLFTYLVAAFVRILGNTILAIRLPAAMLGVLAVAACYALGRRLVGPWQALFAAALVAVTFWTMALSRIGYRANALPVFFLLWLLSFWACRGRHELRPYLVCGLLLGLMQYTYTAARFVPLLALILAWDWRKALDRRGLLVVGGRGP
jgi:4-amino-4-deoxy-L-arabinose transferase-like glycosyltransferase